MRTALRKVALSNLGRGASAKALEEGRPAMCQAPVTTVPSAVAKMASRTKTDACLSDQPCIAFILSAIWSNKFFSGFSTIILMKGLISPLKTCQASVVPPVSVR